MLARDRCTYDHPNDPSGNYYPRPTAEQHRYPSASNIRPYRWYWVRDRPQRKVHLARKEILGTSDLVGMFHWRSSPITSNRAPALTPEPSGSLVCHFASDLLTRILMAMLANAAILKSDFGAVTPVSSWDGLIILCRNSLVLISVIGKLHEGDTKFSRPRYVD